MNVNLLPVWIWLPIFFIYFIYLYVGVEGVTPGLLLGDGCGSCPPTWPPWPRYGWRCCSATSSPAIIIPTSPCRSVSWLRHPDTDEHSRGSVDCWCHLLVCKNGAYEAPFGPKKVQQGIRISSTDHGPLPVLWSTSRPQQGHPAAYHQSLQWEVLHSQASVKWGSTTAWGWSAAGCRCSTTTSRFYLWSPTEIGVVYTTWGWPAGSQP